MIQDFMSAKWAAVGPVLGDHLWQSTLFAIIAGLLTLLLRGNSARTRYWLWRAASIKFLLPFSLLVGLGSHLASPRPSAGANASLHFAIEQVSQPFTPATTLIAPLPPADAAASPSSMHLLPLVLPAVWLIGLITVLAIWLLRWREVAAVLREAEPLRKGRELDALRRLERMSETRKPLAMVLSRTSLEPGIFGIIRPLLIWPAGISERLDDAHLDAILAHELWHVRRRDNLAAVMHMVVETIFWFHPLVWWLGKQLVDERERACDEGVLEFGSQRQVYAESILKTCEFCVEAPLPCMSGVTGADLKKRIVRIMSQRAARQLDFSRKLLLSIAGLAAITVPVAFGLLDTTQGRAQSTTQGAPATTFVYEVASIKPSKPDNSGLMRVRLMYSPDGLSATNVSLRALIQDAYGVQDHQLAGAPGWLDSERYDIEAKMEPSVADQLRKLGPEERKAARQAMFQALLADRLKLTIHRDTKELPIYALVVAKNGPKLQEAKPGDTYPNGIKGPNGPGGAGTMRMGRGEVTGQGLPITDVVRLLTAQLHRTVVDKTGLTGKYDFTLHWTPEDGDPSFRDPFKGRPTDSAPPSDSSGPSLFTAIQEQLGLKLESQKGSVEIIVIDHVEKPSEN